MWLTARQQRRDPKNGKRPGEDPAFSINGQREEMLA